MTRPILYTVGHSTRTLEAFADTLASADVKTLVDVRRYPSSRRNPEYNVDALRKALFRAGVRYVYLGDELGGYRDARADSQHTALAGSSFQAYADHMETSLFARGYGRLVAEVEASATAVMCSERNPKKCHRRMIADRAAADGFRVVHLLDASKSEMHRANPAARLADGELVYRERSLDDFHA